MDECVLDYLDSYKRLDQLCRDMFRSKDGVTEYINQMDRVISRINSKQDWRDFEIILYIVQNVQSVLRKILMKLNISLN